MNETGIECQRVNNYPLIKTKSIMRKRLFIILSLLITTCGFAMAQALIRGSVVSDSDGSPVIGATIVVDGTSKGTVTNGDGKFSITLPAGKKNVRISYIGFEPQTVAAKNGMKVKLLEAKNELAETIITGYGNFKKASFTGSSVIFTIIGGS